MMAMMMRMNINDNWEEKETKMIFLTEMLLVLYLEVFVSQNYPSTSSEQSSAHVSAAI